MILKEFDHVAIPKEIRESVYSLVHGPGRNWPVTDFMRQIIDQHLPNLGKYPDIYRTPEQVRWSVAGGVRKQLEVAFNLLDGNVKGKNILDLGCGSMDDNVEERNYMFFDQNQPWFCRVMQRLSAHAIGIDVGSLAGEEFDAHQLDLCENDALGFLEDNSIDLGISNRLFNSPELERRITGLGWGHGSHVPGEALGEILLPQLVRVVKPGCYFTYYADTNQYGTLQREIPFGWPFIQRIPFTEALIVDGKIREFTLREARQYYPKEIA